MHDLIKSEIELTGYTSDIIPCLEQQPEPKFKALAQAAKNGSGESWLELCSKFHVTLQELEHIWVEQAKSKGRIKVATRLPKVMESVVNDAVTSYLTCPDCCGIGRLEDEQEVFPICERCKGTGRLTEKGDREAQKLVLETMGMTGKQAPLINVDHMGHTFKLENLVTDAAKLLKGEVIDV